MLYCSQVGCRYCRTRMIQHLIFGPFSCLFIIFNTVNPTTRIIQLQHLFVGPMAGRINRVLLYLKYLFESFLDYCN